MYKFKDKIFSLDEISKAANTSNMSIDDYIQKAGITQEPDKEQDFLNPTAPGAVVGETTAPDTESLSVDGSLESVDRCPRGFTKGPSGLCEKKVPGGNRGPSKITLTPQIASQYLEAEDRYTEQGKVFSKNAVDLFNSSLGFNIAQDLGIEYLSDLQKVNNPQFINAYKKYVYNNSKFDVDDLEFKDEAFNNAMSIIQEKEFERDMADKIKKFGDSLDDKILLAERQRRGKTNFINRYRKEDGSNDLLELITINADLQKLMSDKDIDGFDNQEQIKKLNDRKSVLAKNLGFEDDQPFMFKTSNRGWIRSDMEEELPDDEQKIDLAEYMEAMLNYFSTEQQEDQADINDIFDSNGDNVVSDYERLKGNLDLTYLELNDLDKNLNKTYDIKWTSAAVGRALGNKLGYTLGDDKVYRNVSLRDMVSVAHMQNNKIDGGVFTIHYDEGPAEGGEIRQIDLYDTTKLYSEQQVELFAKKDALERIVFTGINPKSYVQKPLKEGLYSFRSSYLNKLDIDRAKFGIENRKTILDTEFSDAWGFKNTFDDVFQEDISSTIGLMENILGPESITSEQIENSKPTNLTAVSQAVGHVPVMALEFGLVGGGLGLMTRLSPGMGAFKVRSLAENYNKWKVPTYTTAGGEITLTLPTIEKMSKLYANNLESYIKAKGLIKTKGSLFNPLKVFAYDALLAEGTLRIVEGDEMKYVGVGFVFSDRVLGATAGKLKRLVFGERNPALIKAYNSLPPFYKKVVEGGVKFVPGTEAGLALQAIEKDLMGNQAFATFIEQNYGNEDDVTQRFITSFVSGMAFSGASGLRTNTMLPESWLTSRRGKLRKKYTTDGKFSLESMSAADRGLYDMLGQELAIRHDTKVQSNAYVEQYWTKKMDRIKKAENIDIPFKFIRDVDAKPVSLKFGADGKGYMVLNTPKLTENMIPHEFWHLLSRFKIKDPNFAISVKKRIDPLLDKLFKQAGGNETFSNVLKEIYGTNVDLTTQKGKEFIAEEYFGNLLELLANKSIRKDIVESGLLPDLKGSMQKMLVDLVAKNPRLFETTLFKSLPNKLLPEQWSPKLTIDYLTSMSEVGKKGDVTRFKESLEWLNKYQFEGKNGNDLKTPDGKVIEYNAIGGKLLERLELESKQIQNDYEIFKNSGKEFPIELINPYAKEGTSADIINNYVRGWVIRKFGKDAEGNIRDLTKEQIEELTSHTLFHKRGVLGVIEKYKGGQPITKTIKQHLDGDMFSRFMDIYKDSILGSKKLEEGGEITYDPTYVETKNRIEFGSFIKSDGTQLNLSKVLSNADIIVDKLLTTTGRQTELTFMDFASGPFDFLSTAKKPPMKLMADVREAFGSTTAERNANIKANIERIYEMIPESFDMKSQQSTQVIKGQSIFKEFFDISKTERYPKSKVGDNQPFKANKKQLKYDENGQLTPESQQLLNRFTEVLTEGRVDAKHTRLFNVLSQAIQVRRATDKLNNMSQEGADIPSNIKDAAYLSTIFQSIGNLKSVQGKAFASTDIGQQLQKRGITTLDGGLAFLRNFNPLTASKEDIALKNALAFARESGLEKNGEGFTAKIKSYKDGEYVTTWKTWTSSVRGKESEAAQLAHSKEFLNPIAEFIPKEIVDAANKFQTNIFSDFFNLRSQRLAGNRRGKNGEAFIEALKSSKKFEYDFVENPQYKKILDNGLKAFNSGKLLFEVKEFAEKVDPILRRTDIDVTKKLELIEKVYGPEFGKNLEAIDKMMGVFYESYLNASKNPTQRLERERNLANHFQMQSSNPFSVRGIAQYTSVYIPSLRKGESAAEFNKRLGEYFKKKRKGEHIKSSSDFAFETFKDLIEGNYFKNYDGRKLNFEQSYGPEASWNLVDNIGRNNNQGYDRMLANHDIFKNTYDIATKKSFYDLYAESQMIKELSGKKLSESNQLKIDQQLKRNELQTEYNSRNLSEYLNKEIFEQNFEIPADAIISPTKAKRRGRENKQWNLFSSKASDAELLIYRTLGKGETGNKQFEWWKENFLKPFARADNAVNAFEVKVIKDLKTVLNSNKSLKKELNQVNNKIGYKNSEALRIYLWARQGEKIPGLTKTDLNAVVKEVEKNPELVKLANSLSFITGGYGWGKPRENWIDTTLHGDVLNIVRNSARPDIFRQWVENKNEIFSPENLRKMEYQFGENYVEAWKNMLWRMETGQSRRKNMGKFESGLNDYITGGQSTIMFWNMKTSLTQLTSIPNYINWGDNNFFAASKAVANIPQFAKDVRTLFMSDFAVGRRDNLKMNVNEAELATIMQRGGGFNGVLNYVLKQGYTPTRAADGVAIAVGGASFYRNRINTYKREGFKETEAEKKAMEDWIEVTQENQQSSRADRISYQQASTLGKVILNFANTPMQYNRIMYRSYKDLINRRGDDKTNLSKIVHYGLLQSTMFTALQQAVFALYTGDARPEDADKKAFKMIDSMTQTWLRGFGFGGAGVDMTKQVFIDLYKRAQGDNYNKDLGEAAWKVFSISPPISAKVDKLRRSFDTLEYEGDNMLRNPLDPDDPFYSMLGQGLEGVFNVPMNRALIKLQNIRNFMDEEIEWYNRLFSILGYNEHALLISDSEPTRKPKKNLDIFGQENIFKGNDIFKTDNIFKK
tara:strand:- start:731 stop:8542 length:7812 start_codon:yes stop_codon:yes gene_type:complete